MLNEVSGATLHSCRNGICNLPHIMLAIVHDVYVFPAIKIQTHRRFHFGRQRCPESAEDKSSRTLQSEPIARCGQITKQ